MRRSLTIGIALCLLAIVPSTAFAQGEMQTRQQTQFQDRTQDQTCTQVQMRTQQQECTQEQECDQRQTQSRTQTQSQTRTQPQFQTQQQAQTQSQVQAQQQEQSDCAAGQGVTEQFRIQAALGAHAPAATTAVSRTERLRSFSARVRELFTNAFWQV